MSTPYDFSRYDETDHDLDYENDFDDKVQAKDIIEELEDFTCLTKVGMITLNKDKIIVNKKNIKKEFLYEDINDVNIKFGSVFLPNKITLTLKDGSTFVIPTSKYGSECGQKLKHEIDKRCKLNAYEPDSFRSPFVVIFSAANMFTAVIGGCILLLHFIGGVALLSVKGVGFLIGIPLIVTSIVVEIIIIKSSSSEIEGTCPICYSKLKGTKKVKHIYCKKCKEKINIKHDYFDAL